MKKVLSFIFSFILFFYSQVFSMGTPVDTGLQQPPASEMGAGGMGTAPVDEEGQDVEEESGMGMSAQPADMGMDAEEPEQVPAEGMGEPVEDMGMQDTGMGTSPAEGMEVPVAPSMGAPADAQQQPAAPQAPPVEFKQATWPQAVELQEEGQAIVSEGFQGDLSSYIDQANDINSEINETVQKITGLKKDMWKKFKELDKKLDLFFQDVGFISGQKSKERLFFQEKK